ncbi:TPM domain-containing protein [Methylomonas sp. EFPC1]|uniref:TPM domain-containing protein n=1 Tax=Methylomonas sp. EFPC1 TaxID=2812647 RepID=UPI0019677356|nr:TPM domain-containing protein [Methylomonas sp. EFPC1]QSB03284.1 TPM domain-containing protein [Methylomonas sp. EFPC1]
MQVIRFLKHVFSGPWRVRLAFSKRSLQAIEAAITESETSHLGEIRFVVESALEIGELLQGVTPRQRALEVFSQCRIWDTEHNTGVLIYLLFADRDVEIVADRGIHARVGEAVWARICEQMEAQLRAGRFELGVIEGIALITAQLQQHFPALNKENPNEITNAPLVL